MKYQEKSTSCSRKHSVPHFLRTGTRSTNVVIGLFNWPGRLFWNWFPRV